MKSTIIVTKTKIKKIEKTKFLKTSLKIADIPFLYN